MTSTTAREAGRAFRGAWLDDLAVIAANWLDEHPVRRRGLLALILALTGPVLVGASPYAMVGLLLMLLPRLPRVGGRVAFGTGLLLALAGATRLLLVGREWGSLPQEDGLGLLLFAVGILLGARRGPWLPWLACGVAAGILLDVRTIGTVIPRSGPVGGTLLLIFVSRVSAARRTLSSPETAREYLAISLQRRPWLTSFMICMIATVLPSGGTGVSPAIGAALVALLFHATWRAPALLDKASAWTAALVVPAASVLIFWWLPRETLGGNAPMPGGLTVWDFVLSPAAAIPLAIGWLVGRRPPGRRVSWFDGLLIAVATLAAPVTMFAVERATDGATSYPDLPLEYRFGLDHRVLWVALTAAWLPLFHRLVTSAVSARRIVIGACVAGAVQLGAMIAVTSVEHANVTILRGALFPVVQWVVGALFVLLARDVAQVTRIPVDHPIIADHSRIADHAGA